MSVLLKSMCGSIIVPLAIPAIMMPSSAVGDILITSQAHMNDAIKGNMKLEVRSLSQLCLESMFPKI